MQHESGLAPLEEADPAAFASVSLLFSDVDHTLTTEAGQIPTRVVRSLEALFESGVRVCLVTGRSAGWGQALAAYLPGVWGALAENGRTLSRGEEAVRPLGPARGRGEPTRAYLESAARAPAERFGWRPTTDDVFRLHEVTFDRARDFDAAALADARRLVPDDVEVIMSSIHIHVRPAGWSKADGARLVARELLGSDAGDDLRIAAVGDSGNDAPVFRAYRVRSVGVANVRSALEVLGDDVPAYVTRSAYADGFVELAERILAAR